MAKTIFEEMGGTYTQVGDYLLPDLKLPEEEQQPIGVWGQRHRRYLKDHRRATYATLQKGMISYEKENYIFLDFACNGYCISCCNGFCSIGL